MSLTYRKLALALAALAGLWLFGACDDDGGDGDADTDTDVDGDGDADGDGDVDGDGDIDGDIDGDVDGDVDGDADGDTAADGDTDFVTCAEALGCIDACGNDNDCARGCPLPCGPAGTELAAVATCIVRQCATQCADRESEACDTCVEENCALQIVSCNTASCVAGELSCGEVTVCLAVCGTDTGCADGCRESVCPAGTDELTAFWDCLEDSCDAQCSDLGASDCRTCLGTSCGAQSGACLIAPCYPVEG
jgi:hypothetical protein